MKLSKNFDSNEFKCKCLGNCGFDTVDPELIEVLQELREAAGQPIIINSACRCKTHNKDVGGKLNSQHVKGKAADIVVANISSIFVWGYLNEKHPDKYGIGLYKNFTHLDVREKKARWRTVS